MSRGIRCRLTLRRFTITATTAAIAIAGLLTPALTGTATAVPEMNWDRLAACESGGNWAANTGNGYYGGLQFSMSTWRAHGGAGNPARNSRAQQIAIAERVLRTQGPRAWPACSPGATRHAPYRPAAYVMMTAPSPQAAPNPDLAASATPARAARAAVSQQGAPYRTGGQSPGGFDCSGLVRWAYGQAGVTLPRTAAEQATAGREVQLSELRPGDILYFYRPVGHVVLYVGDGRIVEASQPGRPVRVRAMYREGLRGARRVS